MADQTNTPVESDKHYVRFDLSQRIEHIVFLLSFSLLGLTGLVQKYAEVARKPVHHFCVWRY